MDAFRSLIEKKKLNETQTHMYTHYLYRDKNNDLVIENIL